jgi:predicted small lipoprotein YifL
VQGFLQIHHNLTAVFKGQGDHPAVALHIDVAIAGLIDLVTSQLNGVEQGFGAVHEFKVSHYNRLMLGQSEILVSPSLGQPRLVTLSMLSMQVLLKITLSGLLLGSLVGCGQRGPLVLPKEPAAADRATLPQTLLPDAWRTQPQKPGSGQNSGPESQPSPTENTD